MSYRSISNIDPWPSVCPPVEDLSVDELLVFLDDASEDFLTPWEHSFCQSISSQLRNSQRLSRKQLAILDRGLLKTLWDNDPELWRGSYLTELDWVL